MPIIGVEPEWFMKTQTHAYIAWLGQVHARHVP